MRPRSLTRKSLAVLAALPLAAAGWLAATLSPAAAATPQDVVNYLQQISGNHVVSSVHNKEPLSNPSQAHALTGRWPGLWGGELGFRSDDPADRQSLVNQANAEWNSGSLVSLTWHMCRPEVANCEFNGGIWQTWHLPT
ncbi:hypothetical protein ACIQAC_05220 [Streptomyces sp. NPDC088387]|uniref:hypothetical protein n=1 Tax=Streptomyces sp. NPDC088387 TaxID=3365859 RepID=UPI00380A39A2